MEANSNFAVHTSIFLSNGTGGDYQGGASLYVDNDAAASQLIGQGAESLFLSYGGRLPARAGIRAVLQIWWNERPKAETDYCDASTE